MQLYIKNNHPLSAQICYNEALHLSVKSNHFCPSLEIGDRFLKVIAYSLTLLYSIKVCKLNR